MTVAVGDELPVLELRVTRSDLVRYAGASGDFNPIHWSDRVAAGVGLPGVIAHGMLTMALAGRLVTRWAGDPAAVRSYGVRFTRPVVVPDDDDGALVEISGKVTELEEAPDGARVATIAVTAKFDGRTVLGRATAEVALPR
jgi:acyl dehydratase